MQLLNIVAHATLLLGMPYLNINIVTYDFISDLWVHIGSVLFMFHIPTEMSPTYMQALNGFNIHIRACMITVMVR